MIIRVTGIRAALSDDLSDLRVFCCRKLKIESRQIRSVKLFKKSVDARKKSDVHFILSIDIETDNAKLLKRLKNASEVTYTEYKTGTVPENSERPVIVGFGPAGMFAALVLAMAGARPIVLERGLDVDRRCEKVDEFRSTGKLDTECNVQFGEGGAGTFSDGKLNTGIRDGRIGWIIERFVEFGAPEEIMYLAKPHIGTDKLCGAVKSLRERVISLGGEVHFGAKVTELSMTGGTVTSVEYTEDGSSHSIVTHNVILATGHSARDIFEMLYEKQISLSQKNFAVGVRIEHRRENIDRAMYGDSSGHPALKAADYKLAVHLPNGRALYTFCMCPGGYVMAASSEEGRLAVNGMSCFARDAENSNSALLVNVDTADYGTDHPLAGMYFQREIEEKAYRAGGSSYFAPCIKVGDFLSRTLSDGFGKVLPSYRPGVKAASPDEYLPDFVCETLRLGIPEMGKKIPGFDSPDAVLTGVESRSSSPVRIDRGDDLQSVSVKGLYPCGEGAGYAGGIVSAAVDGMKCAEAVINKLNNL